MTDFYDPSHLGNLFGIKGPMYGPRGHLGVDFNKMPAGTGIPAWRAGTVVKRGTSRTLGNYLIVRTDIGYVGYHHMQGVAFVPVGTDVVTGEIIGRLGMTGSLATGVHLHTTLADSAVVGGQDVHDPLPHIRGSLSTAKSGSEPLASVTAHPRGNTVMDLYFCHDNNGPLWTLVDHANREFAQTRDQRRANLWAILYRPDNAAKDINSSGNLAMLLGDGAYASTAWPFTRASLK